MDTIVLSVKAISIFSTFGTNLILRTLTSTSGSICNMLVRLTAYDQPYAQDVVTKLNKIDLKFTVNILEQLVKENIDKDISVSVKQALLGVNDILLTIYNELREIQISLDKHEKKYFYKWRCFDCKCNINVIESHKRILDNRYKILIDLLKIYDINAIHNIQEANIEKEKIEIVDIV